MKKAVLITIGAVCGTTSLVAAGVFLPSLFLTSSPSTVQVNSNTALISSNTKSSISVKDALLGTKSVNNGNYVLYFGSEGLDSNFKFLYDIPSEANIDELKENQMNRRDRQLSGDYWSAINYILNNEYSSENIGTKPEFIAYVNTLGSWTVNARNQLAKEITNCLRDVLNVRDTYTDLKQDDKDIINQKFNFVKTNIQDSAIVKRYLNYSEITSFFSALKRPFSEALGNSSSISPELAKKPLYEAVNWTISPSIINFQTSPFATYSTWDSQTKYYDSSSYAEEFRELWNFIKNNELFSGRVKEIDTCQGFILGYKNGNLVDFCDLSFNAESTDSSTDDSGNSDSTTTETQSLRFSDIRATQATSNAIPEPTENSFYSWLKSSYPVENNN